MPKSLAKVQKKISKKKGSTRSLNENSKDAQRYLSRHDEELAELKSQRRPGRPSSTREDLLKQHTQTEDREYTGGFWMPDLTDGGNLKTLRGWNGEWTALNTLKYVRVSRGGTNKPSSFPPKGLS
ncbi:translation machinery-associated protein 16, partial [Lecanoromycetidae sp. Uapishka_2]